MISSLSSFNSSYMTMLLWSLLMLLLYYMLKYTKQFIGWVAKLTRMSIALQRFPGPPRNWPFGNMHLFPGLPGEKGLVLLEDQMNAYYPRLFALWFPVSTRPFLITCHPETCKQVLKHTLQKPVKYGGYSGLIPWIGESMFLNHGKKWLRNRRLLTPAFHFDVLKPYMKIYNEAADTLMDKLSETKTKKQSLDIFGPVGLCTLDIILKCAFSSDMEVQKTGNNHPYVNAVKSMAQLFIKRRFNPLLRFATIYNLTSDGRAFNRYGKFVHEISTDVINRRRRIIEEKPETVKTLHPDFLDILLLAKDEDGTGLTDREIRDEVDAFLFAGHDTTSSTISWALYTLAQHPEHQQKCYEEISAVLAGRTTQDIKWDDLGRLPYLTMCIKESMRLHTPVPYIGREVDKEFDLDGVTLPVGTNVQVNFHLMHNNKAVWGDDCKIFKPERFETCDSGVFDSYAFVPFSAGPRNCIGKTLAMHEVKVIISRIISRYHMKIDPVVPALHLQELVTRAENGLYMSFESRESAFNG